ERLGRAGPAVRIKDDAMLRIPVLVVIVVLCLIPTVSARPRIIPIAYPEPLGVIVGKSKTIHLLRVESAGPKGVHFTTKATLKGRLDDAPFRFAELYSIDSGPFPPGLFRKGASVLCFHHQKEMA